MTPIGLQQHLRHWADAVFDGPSSSMAPARVIISRFANLLMRDQIHPPTKPLPGRVIVAGSEVGVGVSAGHGHAGPHATQATLRHPIRGRGFPDVRASYNNCLSLLAGPEDMGHTRQEQSSVVLHAPKKRTFVRRPGAAASARALSEGSSIFSIPRSPAGADRPIPHFATKPSANRRGQHIEPEALTDGPPVRTEQR